MVWVRLPVYFYKRNETFYFSRAIPSDLQHRFKKRKIEVSLRTKSESKAAKSAAALSDRLERYWDSLRMEMIYSRELGLRVTPDAKTTTSAKSFSITEALALHHRLKGGGKTKLFFESSVTWALGPRGCVKERLSACLTSVTTIKHVRLRK